MIREELEEIFTSDDVRRKYNQILSKYRVEYINLKKSGSSPSDWKYWNIFNETYPKKKKNNYYAKY